MGKLFLSILSIFIIFNYSFGDKKNIEDNFPSPTSFTQHDPVFKSKIFRNDTLKNNITSTGFGFDIYKDKTLFIHQPNIPAVQGNPGFKTSNDAKRVAELMLEKIRGNIFPPSVSKRELDSLGVFK